MKSTLSYCNVSACERVRSSFQANASSRLSPGRNGRVGALVFAGGLAKRALYSVINAGRTALPSARVRTPASRNSLTRRSCKVLCARSTRPLGLARIGADDVDVQRVERAAKLGHAVAAKRPRMVDAEDAVLVAVECHRLAPGFRIG